MRYVINGFDNCGWSFVGSADSLEEAEKIVEEDWEEISDSYKEAYIVPESCTWRHKKSKPLPFLNRSEDVEDLKSKEDRFCYQILDLENLDSYMS